MEGFNEQHFSGLAIDHLGLIADKIQDLNLIKGIDERLPLQSDCGVKTTMGERVAAMILNGLGFVDNRLYLFPDFLAKKPVTRLFGKPMEASWFNDDALGRCLDAIAAYGSTKLFTELSFEIGISKNFLGKSAHFDTSTLQLEGEYAAYDETSDSALPKKNATPLPLRGYSKSHRHDLKQMVILLATTGKANFPIWMESHSGNASDQRVMPEAAARMQALCKGLAEAPDFLYVGDSALYANILSHSEQMKWLTRVPEKIREARLLVERAESEINWTPLSNGYRYSVTDSDYGDVRQRWVMIFSQQAYEREIKTLERVIAKEHSALEKAWWHLGCESFSCESDAKKAIKALSKEMKYHQVETTLKEITGYSGKGRPAKNAEPTPMGYQVTYTLSPDEEKVKKIRCRKGRFMLSTNELDKEKLPDEQVLAEYKKQSGTESGFKFIKDNRFQVDSVFLKTASRIDALMMVMTLCLLVYGVSQYELREALQNAGDTIPNQQHKPTDKPSMKWVYFLFSGAHELTIDLGEQSQQIVINVNAVMKQIVRYFGPRAQAIYFNST